MQPVHASLKPPFYRSRVTRLAYPLIALLLAGCGDDRPPAAQDLADLDRELATDNAHDPALTAALADQIMVDPALVQSANAHAVRPPDQPQSAGIAPDQPPVDPVPAAAVPAAPTSRADCPDCAARRNTLTIGALAERQRDAATAGCAASIGYSATWATRLPDALPLYPGATIREAAGSDANGCRLRVVAFATGASPAKAIGFYHARARAAGYTAEVQADRDSRIVGGTRGDAAFVIYADPRAGGGSDVQMVVNGG